MQTMLVKISTSLFRSRDYDVIDAWRGVQTQEIRDPHGCMRNLPSSAGICAISSRVLFEEFRAMIRCGASDANELEGLPGEAAELRMQGTLCRLDAKCAAITYNTNEQVFARYLKLHTWELDDGEVQPQPM